MPRSSCPREKGKPAEVVNVSLIMDPTLIAIGTSLKREFYLDAIAISTIALLSLTTSVACSCTGGQASPIKSKIYHSLAGGHIS